MRRLAKDCRTIGSRHFHHINLCLRAEQNLELVLQRPTGQSVWAGPLLASVSPTELPGSGCRVQGFLYREPTETWWLSLILTMTSGQAISILS